MVRQTEAMGEKGDRLTAESIIRMANAISNNMPDGYDATVLIKTPSTEKLHEIDEELHKSVNNQTEFKHADAVEVSAMGIGFFIT